MPTLTNPHLHITTNLLATLTFLTLTFTLLEPGISALWALNILLLGLSVVALIILLSVYRALNKINTKHLRNYIILFCTTPFIALPLTLLCLYLKSP